MFKVRQHVSGFYSGMLWLLSCLYVADSCNPAACLFSATSVAASADRLERHRRSNRLREQIHTISVNVEVCSVTHDYPFVAWPACSPTMLMCMSNCRSLRDGESAPLDVKDWESQAKEITSDFTSSEKYKSVALHAEVKLAEALERCTRVCPTSYTATGEERPNKLRTAVCCQVCTHNTNFIHTADA